MDILPKGLTIYHSTIHDFEPSNIKTPCWFSTIEEQSHLHLCFKHYGHPCGRLLTYRLRENIKMLDLSQDGYVRMFVNANGNYKLANLMKDSDMYKGYKNYQDQAEIMLVDSSVLEFIGEKEIDLNKQVQYVEKSEGWRMVDATFNGSGDSGDSSDSGDSGHFDVNCCCVPRRSREKKYQNKRNHIVPI